MTRRRLLLPALRPLPRRLMAAARWWYAVLQHRTAHTPPGYA